MAYELKEGQGSLHKNNKKNENSPDLYGDALINGVPMEISAWVRVGQQSGKKYYSLSIRPKQQNYQNNGGQQRQYKQPANNNHQYQQAQPVQQAQPQSQYQAPAQQEEDNGDLPF